MNTAIVEVFRTKADGVSVFRKTATQLQRYYTNWRKSNNRTSASVTTRESTRSVRTSNRIPPSTLLFPSAAAPVQRQVPPVPVPQTIASPVPVPQTIAPPVPNQPSEIVTTVPVPQPAHHASLDIRLAPSSAPAVEAVLLDVAPSSASKRRLSAPVRDPDEPKRVRKPKTNCKVCGNDECNGKYNRKWCSG